MPFLTRPHFEDRQIVQYSEDSIQLSGLTKIAPTILDFSGATTGETTVTINNITGYLNGQRPYGLKVEPAKVTISGTTGTTTQNVTGFVLKSADPFGSVEWAPISGVSWSVSACTSPLYVSAIEACPNPTDPLYITAGNVQFGSSPSLIADIANTRLGIGIGSPTERLHIEGGNALIEYGQDASTRLDVKNYNGGNDAFAHFALSVSGTSTSNPKFGSIIAIGPDSIPTGSFMGSYLPDSLNIITANGSAATRMHINIGSRRTNGETRFFSGEDFDVSNLVGVVYSTGLTITDMVNTNTLRVRNGATSGYVLTSDSNGVGTWQFNSTGFSGNTSGTCITDLYITNLYGCSPVTVHDSLQHVTSSGTGVNSIAWGEGALASGDYSHAQGGSGTDLSAVFHRVTASGNYSHAQGFGVASGVGSHAEGGINGKSISPTSATTFSAHAEGVLTLASGEASHAEGGESIASGPFSHAEGLRTVASVNYSHAEGKETLAGGIGSHAEGEGTVATGYTSHAEGFGTVAGGDYSHAGGLNSRAFGDTSYVYGVNNSVLSDKSSILGGDSNTINTNSIGSSIVGGQNNVLSGNTSGSTIIGGDNNTILDSGSSVITGGNNNTNKGDNSAIIGGVNNTILPGVQRAVILGGQNITANKDDIVLMDSLGTYNSSTMAGLTVNGGNLVIADEMVLSSGVVTTGSVPAPGPTITGKTTWILNLTGANTSALPNANGAGQRLAVYIRAGGGGGNSMTITPATLNGYSTITLTNNGESVDLIYDFTSGWTVIGGNGYILA